MKQKITTLMKQISNSWHLMASALSFIIFHLSFSPAGAQVGTWRAYMSYAEPQQIAKGGNQLFVRASNDLYSYNLNDHSITTYDKINALSDNFITHIAWNTAASRLIIVYQNSNIDLMDSQGRVTNVSAIYSKAMTQDKTVNSIYMNDIYAYLATGFGVVKVNMQRAEVAESYILDQDISAVDISGSSIFVRTKAGNVLTASLSSNLIDPHSWTAGTVPSGIFTQDTTDWDEYHELVETLKPDGPAYNYFNSIFFFDNKLFSSGGGWRDGTQFSRPGCVQIMNEEKNWVCITSVNPLSGNTFKDVTSIAVDPNDSEHFFFSTCGTGIYEFRNYEQVNNYTMDNSPLISAIDATNANAVNYVRVDGLAFDNNGCLWMSNSSRLSAYPILRLNTKTSEWQSFTNDKIVYNDTQLRILRNSIIDKKGNIWIANEHHTHPCTIKINTTTDQFERFDTFINQDGISYEPHYVRCVAADLEGNIWIGTNVGLFCYDENQQNDATLGFTQVKVPRNDGSNYADYLMDGVDVSVITIDGANRKWIGTDGGGVYVISADNYEQLHHFTTSNSKLISNNIESISINNETGEVFIGTNQGLCSYMSDATSAVETMEKDDIYVYPNPVHADYDGYITITGLSFNADVKILSVSGKLIAQGRSNGGTFTWDGRDTSGKRVASGVYMIATATSEGNKGVVAKVAFVN